MSGASVKVRLLFVDEGAFHDEQVEIPASSVDRYDRLIDCVLEDPAVLKTVHVDMERLVAAFRQE